MIISLVLLPCLLCLINLQVSLAVTCRSDTECNSAQVWSTNILCRINGGKADERAKGYLDWIMTIKNETNKKHRLEAVKYLANVVDFLNNKITTLHPKNRLERMAVFEKQIDVYGKAFDEKWEPSNSPCGVGSVTVSCGSRNIANEPTCTIP